LKSFSITSFSYSGIKIALESLQAEYFQNVQDFCISGTIPVESFSSLKVEPKFKFRTLTLTDSLYFRHYETYVLESILCKALEFSLKIERLILKWSRQWIKIQEHEVFDFRDSDECSAYDESEETEIEKYETYNEDAKRGWAWKSCVNLERTIKKLNLTDLTFVFEAENSWDYSRILAQTWFGTLATSSLWTVLLRQNEVQLLIK
jgi:hypothetical protein